MNTPHDPPDPLLQSLADEAADLPARAAIEARRRNAHRAQNRHRIAMAVTISLLGIVAWLLFPTREVSHSIVAMHRVTPELSPDLAPSAPEPTPLLLVRDGTGKVTRIHVVER